MIQDRRRLVLKASSQVVFDVIERMPNKFPIYGFMEKGPFFFLRILLVDGFGSARAAARLSRPEKELRLEIGDTLGPFTLIESEKPTRYWFSLNAVFFECRTGYSLSPLDGGTELCFDLIAENPTFVERLWWLAFKPFHVLFADKVLQVIKEKTEQHKVI
jgi:hypothetical protein